MARSTPTHLARLTHHDPWRLPARAAKYGIDPTPLLAVVADALRPPDAAD
jgi:hypothetical protein